MGLIRKGLYLGTGGLVAPNSKKQRRALQMLKATQGATSEEIRRTGGRSDFLGFWGATEPVHVVEEAQQREITGVVAEVRSPRKRFVTLVIDGRVREMPLHTLPPAYRQAPAHLQGCTVRVRAPDRNGWAFEVLDAGE